MSDHQVFQYHYQVVATDLDIFGHVNNANYLQMMERARWDFITQNGYGLKKIQQTQKGPVLLQADLKFKRELVDFEKIIIYSQALDLKGKIMYLNQWIEKQSKEIAAECLFTVGFFDIEKRKLLHPTDEWLDACGYKKKA